MAVKDFWKELDMRLKVIISIAAVISTIGGGAAGVHRLYAKEAEFQEFVAMYQFDKKVERKKELRQIIFECKTRYGSDYSRAPDELTREMCRDAEIELETLKEQDKVS
jgi:hypothetical protein